MGMGLKQIWFYKFTTFISLGGTGRKLEILRAVTEIRILVFAVSDLLILLQCFYIHKIREFNL